MAKRRLPKWLFEFVDRGTEDELALRNNRAAFERVKLKTQVLMDVSKRSTAVTLFGKQHDMPVGVAPTGAAGMLYYKGELELARAAKAANVPFTVATASQTSLEDVARIVGGTLWFQLYMWSDIRMSHVLVERARNAGYDALVVTVDGPVNTNREYNIRNGFSIPFRYNRRNIAGVLARPGWLTSVIFRYLLTTGMPRRENYPSDLKERFTQVSAAERKTKNDALTWADLDRLREMWPGKLIVKGILTPHDAELAVAHGADGIIVSNHGGRNFDSSMAPIEALSPIVDAVGERTTVIVDSSFRRGSDVVKALAIGAKFVMVGRPTLWGTAAGGCAGATRALKFYHDEISRTIAYLGCRSIEELNRDFLQYVPTPHSPSTM
ncbi:alpha-hydroxy-acid oxidizing enzyme [Candidimonas nitroreducens]|uniref:Alpha-hydroxy-acid oxidizing enzyme n=2 Tax=Candidimonas nitroreducens TaxID=683354 RepID=A0A225M9K8_9BURK|nr:alpha-hydroxy-acid oxidizing enzyme [Candidimonas nitroreducens]